MANDGRTATDLLSVEGALRRILRDLRPEGTQQVALADASGRVLAEDIEARFSLPGEPVSAMDGYAVRSKDCRAAGARLECIGESAAGHPCDLEVESGKAVRIFTGAILPKGADAIALQEDVEIESGADSRRLVLRESVAPGTFVRPAGLDVRPGDMIASAGCTLSARIVALIAAAGRPVLTVWRQPVIGVLSTGDELVAPGEVPSRGQIISSNAVYLAQMLKCCGAVPVDLGIARDRPGAVLASVRGSESRLDMIVTTGGASVGSHDHVASDLGAGGAGLDFWKIAMRPGKPLIHGQVDGIPLLGLPGNPVSSAVCANVFLRPAVARLGGADYEQPLVRARLLGGLPRNDRRQDYMRARLENDACGEAVVSASSVQDSSMMAVFAASNALILRPPHDEERAEGDFVSVLPLDPWA